MPIIRSPKRRTVSVFTLLSLTVASTSAVEVDPVTECLRTRQCVITVTGALTNTPAMTLVISRSVWSNWSPEQRTAVRAKLGSEALKARSQPERYTDIPPKAPAYRKVLATIQTLDRYTVMVSDTDGRSKPLQFTAQAASGSLPIRKLVVPNDPAVRLTIRPMIRSGLHDPDSLQDFQVLAISPLRKDPSISEVVVGYRARNRLGALGYEESTFFMSYSEAKKQWSIIQVRPR